MTQGPLPGFRLADYLASLETQATHNLAASYCEPMSTGELLAMATEDQRIEFFEQSLVYTNTWGADDLRAGIAGTHDAIDTDHVLAFAGASEGIYAANNILLDSAAHAIVITPNYQSHESLPMAICPTTAVPLSHDQDWTLDVDRVAAEIRPETKLLTINFPHNPSGSIPSLETYDALIELCRHHGIYMLHDEIYRGIGPTGTTSLPLIADRYERGLSVNAVSKAYGLPGLRVGWIATQDRDLLVRMEHLKHYLTVSVPRPSERLAVIALAHREEILGRNREIIDENLPKWDAFFARAPELFEWERPQGSCMGFPRYLGADGVDALCERLMQEAGVLLLPSTVYNTGSGPAIDDRVRIGFGCRGIDDGIATLAHHVVA